MTDYSQWREDRLRELDSIDAQIDKLPLVIGNMVLAYVRELRDWADEVADGEHDSPWAQTTDQRIRQLARELDLITVRAATDDEQAKEES